MADVRARFIARRKLTRFCSCSAIDWATSRASSSGRLISLMLIWICFCVSMCSSLRSASTSWPLLPITMPGRAVKMSTVSLVASFLMWMSERPACDRLAEDVSRTARSSSRDAEKSRVENQLLFQPLIMPSRNPVGMNFLPTSDLSFVPASAPGQSDRDVTCALQDAGGAAHRARTEALDRRPRVDRDVRQRPFRRSACRGCGRRSRRPIRAPCAPAPRRRASRTRGSHGASGTLLPRTRSATSRAFRGERAHTSRSR